MPNCDRDAGTDLHAHGAKQHAAERSAATWPNRESLPSSIFRAARNIDLDRGDLRLESLEAHARALEHDEEGHVDGGDRHDGCE